MADALLIRTLRNRLGETQTDFARRIGIAQNTLCKWEANGIPHRSYGRVLLERALPEIEAEANRKSPPRAAHAPAATAKS